MKITVTIISKDLFTNSLFSSLCVLSYKPKTRIWFSASWGTGKTKYLFFIYS